MVPGWSGRRRQIKPPAQVSASTRSSRGWEDSERTPGRTRLQPSLVGGRGEGGPGPSRGPTSDLPTILPHHMAADPGRDDGGITPSCRSSPPGPPCATGDPGRPGRAKRMVREEIQSDGQDTAGSLPWGRGEGACAGDYSAPCPQGLREKPSLIHTRGPSHTRTATGATPGGQQTSSVPGGCPGATCQRLSPRAHSTCSRLHPQSLS